MFIEVAKKSLLFRFAAHALNQRVDHAVNQTILLDKGESGAGDQYGRQAVNSGP
jgi:hypothetical protein